MEHKNILDSSNEFHNSFCEHVEKYGFNEPAKLAAEAKIAWLILMAKKHGVTLDIRN
ncbi:hypothetical protein WKH57_01150 [Niallia taxi]|uniref:hypothetical protein n=1 Tax=Niallia taxi TaxID=2499688 RepID=UPI003174735C